MKRWSQLIVLASCFCCLAGCATGGASKPEQQRQADVLRQLGEAYMAEQNFAQALAEFLKAEELNSDDHLLHNDLGIIYMAKNQFDMAISHFKRALDIKPDFATASNNLGAAYLANKEWDAAIETAKALTMNLLYATPHYPLANLGKAYYEKKEFSESEKYYQEALKEKPGFVNALYGLGRTYLSMGTVQKAAEYFQRAVDGAPQLAEAQFDLAHAHRLLGNYEKAKQGYTRVIELSPDGDLAREAKTYLFDMR